MGLERVWVRLHQKNAEGEFFCYYYSLKFETKYVLKYEKQQ